MVEGEAESVAEGIIFTSVHDAFILPSFAPAQVQVKELVPSTLPVLEPEAQA